MRIDHADALAHVFQCRFQQALVEAQHLGGLADGAGDRFQWCGTAITRGLDQQPRHACADHGGELALNGGDAFIVQHLPGMPGHQLPRPFLAEEAAGRLAQRCGGDRVALQGQRGAYRTGHYRHGEQVDRQAGAHADGDVPGLHLQREQRKPMIAVGARRRRQHHRQQHQPQPHQRAEHDAGHDRR
ncbi:hypothetical protein D3C71_1331070 [compost metagenome]